MDYKVFNLFSRPATAVLYGACSSVGQISWNAKPRFGIALANFFCTCVPPLSPSHISCLSAKYGLWSPSKYRWGFAGVIHWGTPHHTLHVLEKQQTTICSLAGSAGEGWSMQFWGGWFLPPPTNTHTNFSPLPDSQLLSTFKSFPEQVQSRNGWLLVGSALPTHSWSV